MVSVDMPRNFNNLVLQIDRGSVLLRVWTMTGGVSAQVTGMLVERSSGVQEKWVARHYGAGDLRGNPEIAADEFRLLSTLRAEGLRVPAPLYADVRGEVSGSPCMVQTYIEGITRLDMGNDPAMMTQFVAALAQIHGIDWEACGLHFLPDQDDFVQRLLSQEDEDALMREVCQLLREAQLTAVNAKSLLHGDYWPGNVLWQESQLAAVIDWEDAALGDLLADLAWTRIELLWACGQTAMEHFTELYQVMQPNADLARLPYWDLLAGLDKGRRFGGWGLDHETEHQYREKLRWFIHAAKMHL